MGNLIPLNRKMFMMQNFLDLEERLEDLSNDLRKLKEEFASTIVNMDTAKTQRQLNGKSTNTETVL